MASLAGRTQIEAEDVNEMNELFLDAKTSAAMITESHAAHAEAQSSSS